MKSGAGRRAATASRGSEGAAGRARATLRPIGLFLASRLVVAFGLLVCTNVVHRPVVQLLTSWDAKWYLLIARAGYSRALPPGTGNASQSDLGFFPLLPSLIRVVHDATRLGYAASGIVLVFVAGLGATIALWWLLRDRYGVRGADRGTALVVFWPGAFVLSYVYTEALLILLVVVTLLALRHGRWLLAGLCAGLATAADPVAVAVVVPCVIASVHAIRTRGDRRSLLAPLLAPAGVVAFFAYLWAHTGSPLEWFHAQRRGWQGGYYGTGVPKAVLSFVQHGVADMNPGVKTLSAVLAVVMVVAYLRSRAPGTWTGYVLTVLAFGVLSPIIGITPRLLLRDFPLIGVVGARLSDRRFRVVLAISAFAMAALLVAAGTPRFTP